MMMMMMMNFDKLSTVENSALTNVDNTFSYRNQVACQQS